MIANVIFTDATCAVVNAEIDGVAWSVVRLDQQGELPDRVNAWIAEGNRPQPFAAPAIDLIAYAADRRWSTEQGGITLGGVAVATDDTAQRKISELRRRVEVGEIATPFGFKAKNGWFDLDQPTIVAVDRAIALHVQACYAAERKIHAAIRSGAITTTDAIDAAFAAL